MKKLFSLTLAVFFMQSTFLQAQSFKILGTRPLSMGGAHVAVAEGGLAQYWNPAALAVKKNFGVDVPAGAGVELTKNLLREADDLADLASKIDAIQAKDDSSGLTISEYEDFLQAAKEIQDLNKSGLGVVVEIQGGVDLRLGTWALSVNNFTEVGADPFVDTQNLSLVGGDFGTGGVDAAEDFNGGGIGGNTNDPALDATEDQLESVIIDLNTQVGIELPGGITAEQAANEIIAQAENSGMTVAEIEKAVDDIDALATEVAPFLPNSTSSFDNNQTSLTMRGASVNEISLGYGMKLPILQHIPLFEHLYVGGNIKVMNGNVGYATINVTDEDADIDDLLDDFDKNVETSTDLGVDVGVLYDMKDTFLKSRFGLTIRNINQPSFSQPQAAKDAGFTDLTLDPQARAGAAFYPLDWIVIAADIDLTNNLTELPGFKSRLAGAGAEINLINKPWLNFAIRGGVLKNIAEGSGLAYTGGLGLNLMHFRLDVGAAVSSDRVKVEDGDEFPSAARAAINMSVMF